MSTYRKFDKYRQRADFLSDIEFGIDTPANKWISSGTGTPAVAIEAGKGLALSTSAGGTATTFIQRGIISAATRSTPVVLEAGRKAHIVASLDVTDLGDADVFLAFAAGNADPSAQQRVALHFDASENEFIASLGTGAEPAEQVTLEGVLDEFVRDNLLDLEIYHDGDGNVQFYAGRTRIALIKAEFNESTGAHAVVTSPLSPTLGIMNGGVAAVAKVVATTFGYAVQRVPMRH